MILKFGLSAALALTAAPALAQAPAGGTATPPAPPAQPSAAEMSAVQTAAQAFGTCLQGGMQSVPASATPEAGAAGVMSGCATQQHSLVQAVETMIASMPAEQRTEAHTRMESQLAGVPTQLAEGIRQQRAATAAPAATPPAATPPATPATPPPH